MLIITNEDKKEAEEEIALDFSKIKSRIGKLFKKKSAAEVSSSPEKKDSVPQKESSPPEEEISLDFKKVISLTKSQAKWLIPLVCILIAMTFSIYLRTMPLRLPVTDRWAQDTVYKYYYNQLGGQISQQYPNLPAQNLNALIEKEWQKVYQQKQVQIEAQVARLSQEYKNQFRDDQGTPYLLGIDPYYYYRQTYYILKNGFPGSDLKDGKYWDYYRVAPLGKEIESNLHPWVGAFIHKLINLFTTMPLMATFFFVGTIFSALTVIPAFFIGRIITKNNVGGFFTAILIAVSAFFVSRTTGESSDTDVYAVFFPVLITLFFLESLEAKELKKKLIWISLAGLSTGLFAFAWTGWWYIAVFVLATLIAYIFYSLFLHRKEISTVVKSPTIRNHLYLLGAYLLTSGISIGLFTSFTNQFRRIILGPFQFLQLKAVGVTSYWPNIRTTVAELNVPSFSNVIEQLDGNLFLALACAGVLLTVLKKDEQGKWDFRIPFFLALWFVASLFATTKGIRFVLQATPAFALALGALMGFTWHYASRWISQELKLNKLFTKVALFILLSLLLITPIKSGYSQAYNSISNMNDGWYDTLTKIKTEAPQNVVITSWWDFGHWFKAIADRPVTFDGGTQVGYGAYWVGKSLLTNNEKVTVGIVRMLNCGQNNAFNELDKIFGDAPKEIEILNKIILQKKEEAVQTLKDYGLTTEKIAAVLQYTHCDAPPTDYYITSEDMIGKSGVWGHFGSWDFKKAVMYQKTRNLDRQEAVAYLTKIFNLTAEDADKIHSEIQSTEADKWISPWPGYLSRLNDCQGATNQTLLCLISTPQGNAQMEINMLTMNATLKTNNQEVVYPASLVYADKESIKEKKFSGSTLPFSVILIPHGEDAYQNLISDPAHAYSTFTKLFFFDGHGSKCFKKFDETKQFTGGKVTTWVMDYDCQQENKVYFLSQEEVRAAHILISTQDKSVEEALKLIEELRKNVTPQNFADYAQKYSQDPGSKDNGGNLGWFKKGEMVPEFEKAAFSLKKGEISEPIKTQFGYHLILLMDKRTK